MAHWVEAEARRANRNLLITNAVLLVGTIAIFAVTAKDIDLSTQYIPVAVGVGILLLCGWNCVKAMRRYGEIQTTPAWRHVAVYGNVEQIAAQIEQELQTGKMKYGKLTVTPSWIVRRSLFSTWVSPLGDLAWAYKKVTKHYTNFIPTGKSYAAILVGRHRQRIEVSMSQKKTDQLLADPQGCHGRSMVIRRRLPQPGRRTPAGLWRLWIRAANSWRQNPARLGTKRPTEAGLSL